MDEDEHTSLAHDQTRVPLTNIHRVMKKGIPVYGKASKEAKQTVQDIIQEFIVFVTGEAKNICHRDKRKLLSGDDILNALENLGMTKYSEILKAYQTSYRESMAQIPAESDRESEGLPIRDTGNNLRPLSCANKIGLEGLDGALSDSPLEIHGGYGSPPMAKSINSSYEENFPTVVTRGQSIGEESSNPNYTEDIRGLAASNAAFEKNRNDVNPVPTIHHNVTVPAWTIPTALISGIRIPAIDIPELTVSVKLLHENQPTVASGGTARTMGRHRDILSSSYTGKSIGRSKSTVSAQVEEPAPTTEVIDLVTPKSLVSLQLLELDALDAPDFSTPLVANNEGEELL